MNRINKEFGQLSGEELFKPITKRLDKAAKEPEQEVEELGPNYEMDEFDRLNPFEEAFRPDAETPPLPPTQPPPPSPLPQEEEGGDKELPPPPPLLEETTSRKTREEPAATRFLQTSSESVDLQMVNRLIKQYDGNPNYRVKSKPSKFSGYSVDDLKNVRDEILERRRGAPLSQTQLQEGKKRLTPNPPKTRTSSQPSGRGCCESQTRFCHARR